ncbi:hypothetical protein KBD08_02445 [Candidatus Babeliales bacterium]|nr:hypothetical protein [Candidatus Babeliales bacterium]
MFMVYVLLMLLSCCNSTEFAFESSVAHAKSVPDASMSAVKAAKMRDEIANIFITMSFDQSISKEQINAMAGLLRDIVRYCTLLILQEYPLMPLNDLIRHVTNYIPLMIDKVTPEKQALYKSAYTEVQIPLVVDFARRLNPSGAEEIIKRIKPLFDRVPSDILSTDAPRYKFIIGNIPIHDTQDAIRQFLHSQFHTGALDFKIISQNDKTFTKTIAVIFYDDNKTLQKMVQDYEKHKQSQAQNPFVLVNNESQKEWSPARRSIVLEKILDVSEVPTVTVKKSNIGAVHNNAAPKQLPQRPIPLQTKQLASNAPAQSILTNATFVQDLKREINAIITLQEDEEEENEVMSVILQYLIIHEHTKRPSVTYVDLFDEMTKAVFAGDQNGLTWLETLKPKILEILQNIHSFDELNKQLIMQRLYARVQKYVSMAGPEYVQKKPHKPMYALLSYPYRS